MPRGGKKQKRARDQRKRRQEPDTSVTEKQFEDFFKNKPEAGLEDSLDLLFESSYKSRELGYRAILHHLSKAFHESFVDTSKQTIASAVKTSLRKGKNGERYLAARSFSMTCVTLGVECEEVFKEMKQPLMKIVSELTQDAITASACIDALALTCFIGAEEDEDTWTVLTYLYSLFAKSIPNYITAAIDGWVLLLTTVSQTKVVNEILPKALPRFCKLLEKGNVDLKIAVGEAIAVLCSIYMNHAGITQETFDPEVFADYVDVDNLLDILNELGSSGQKKYLSKGDRQRQRQSFKNIIDMVEAGYETEHAMVIKGQPVQISGWCPVKQFQFFRNVLGAGLQMHFEENELLSDIFGVRLSPAANTRMSKVEKRLYMSPNSGVSKDRAQQRSYDRAMKHEQNSQFLYD